MSHLVSLAQTVSLDILRLIFKYVTNESRDRFGDTFSNDYSVKELLYVSSIWRQVALECHWKTIDLTVAAGSIKVRLLHPNRLNDNALPSFAVDYVKVLRINATFSSIANGTAHRVLKEYLGNMAGFPLSLKLQVTVLNDEFRLSDSRDIAISNTLEFVQILKSVAPNTTTAGVSCASSNMPMPEDYEVSLGVLLEDVIGVLTDSLCGGSKISKLDLMNVSLNHASTVDHIPQLTSLRLNCWSTTSLNTTLVHKLANSLNYLDIRIREANKLLYDERGDLVIFPRLHYLQLSSTIRIRPGSNVKTAAGAPFPMLKTLNMPQSYPFTDDIPFRGNSDTLEYLDIGVDKDTVNMLNSTRVFEHRHKVLRYVVVAEKSDNDNIPLVSGSDMTTFFGNLVGTAQVLELSTPSLFDAMMRAAHRKHGFNHIQVLTVHSRELSLFDVLCLLKLLPKLGKLACAISSFGAELNHIDADSLPDHIATTYRDTGKYLKSWRNIGGIIRQRDETAMYIMLLALVCPRLHHINIEGAFIRMFKDVVTTALDSGPYSKYASRLGVLVDFLRERVLY